MGPQTGMAGTRGRGNSAHPALRLDSFSSGFQHKHPGPCSPWLVVAGLRHFSVFSVTFSHSSLITAHYFVWIVDTDHIIAWVSISQWLCLFPRPGVLLSLEAACLVLIYSVGVRPAGPLSCSLPESDFFVFIGLLADLFSCSPRYMMAFLSVFALSVQRVLDFQTEMWTFLYWYVFIYSKVFFFICFNLKIQ